MSTYWLTDAERSELAKSEHYLVSTERELQDYLKHNTLDLIGRALRDIRDHASAALTETRRRFGLE